MILEFLTKLSWAILALTWPVSDWLLDLIFRICMGQPKPLPIIKDEILLDSATKLADMIKKRKVTAEKVMRAYIQRIQEVDPLLNACVDQRFEQAISDSKAVDKMLESGVKRKELEKLSLLGVPFSCKEILGVQGGEASLISSGGSIIGLGTDIGGSIRIPACFCGIYGHKPSRGIVSNYRPTPTINNNLDPFRSTGPMCRYAEDLLPLMQVLSGEDTNKLKLNEKVDFRNVQVYYIEGFPGLLSATYEIKTAVKKAVIHFQTNFGITPIQLNIEELRYAFDIWQYKFLEADDSPLLPDIADKNGNVSWPWEFLKSIFHFSEYDIPIIYFASIGKRHKDTYYRKCLEMYERLKLKLEQILQGDCILLLPTHPEIPPHWTMSIPKVENTGYTSIFNILGYPVTQIPAGLSKGLPIGIQAVSNFYNDHLTIAAAIELEKVFGGWENPCLAVGNSL